MVDKYLSVWRALQLLLGGTCQVPGLYHVLGLAKVDQEDRVNFEAHWTEPDPKPGRV
jgi:hypothetical protein